ncbi:MAG: DUF1826 domain-containing protein [Deltaproteobacteria bacterium]|nr:DUF1826 domain-containing protein [Deltaproteobacteria bacterium]
MANAVLATHESELGALYDHRINVALLRRALSPGLQDEVRRALRTPGFRVLVTVSAGGRAAEGLQGVLQGFPLLEEDVERCVELLSDLTGCKQVGVRIARLQEAMCPRFHVDRVTLRAVCTYEGRGTEFAAEDSVDRRRLGHLAGGVADEDSGLLRSPGAVHVAPAGDLLFLKGEAWPGNAGRGAVHRSPGADAASPRLVMTLDPL